MILYVAFTKRRKNYSTEKRLKSETVKSIVKIQLHLLCQYTRKYKLRISGYWPIKLTVITFYNLDHIKTHLQMNMKSKTWKTESKTSSANQTG